MSKTPITDAIVRPYIDRKEINPDEVDALLDHARFQEEQLRQAHAALDEGKRLRVLIESMIDRSYTGNPAAWNPICAPYPELGRGIVAQCDNFDAAIKALASAPDGKQPTGE